MTQDQALSILKLGHNAYITGSAGSGKTFLLNRFIAYLKEHRVAVGITASTGIAATHMNGMTLHSWSGVGIAEKLTSADMKRIAGRGPLMKRLAKTKVLVIDEVSMLHPYYIDLVDEVCRMAREDQRPFGGLQVVFCGDFFQLPPVGQRRDEVAFINESEAWKRMNPKICYLHEQHRQEKGELSTVLNDIRSNTVSEDTLEPLRECYRRSMGHEVTPTKLHTHNANVDAVNARKLDELPGEHKTFRMFSTGNASLCEALVRSCLAPEELRLKIDACVMFVRNNPDEGYVNGTLGIVRDFADDGNPVVEIASGKLITVYQEGWRIEEDDKVKAEIVQLPLRLAWAITVHKSQGMTLDAAEVDLSKSFVEGMGYVALSRVRSLEGLRLMGLNNMALKVHPKVIALDAELMRLSDRAVDELDETTDVQERHEAYLAGIVPSLEERDLSSREKSVLLIEEHYGIQEVAERRGVTDGTVLTHLEETLDDGQTIDTFHLRKAFPARRFDAIEKAFEKAGDEKLSPARRHLPKDYTWDEMRVVRIILRSESMKEKLKA